MIVCTHTLCASVCVCVHAHACVCVCERACERARMCTCVYVLRKDTSDGPSKTNAYIAWYVNGTIAYFPLGQTKTQDCHLYRQKTKVSGNT